MTWQTFDFDGQSVATKPDCPCDSGGAGGTVDTIARASIDQVIGNPGDLISAGDGTFAANRFWSNPTAATIPIPSPATAAAMLTDGFVEQTATAHPSHDSTANRIGITTVPGVVPLPQAADIPATTVLTNGTTLEVPYGDPLSTLYKYRYDGAVWSLMPSYPRTSAGGDITPLTGEAGEAIAPGQQFFADGEWWENVSAVPVPIPAAPDPPTAASLEANNSFNNIEPPSVERESLFVATVPADTVGNDGDERKITSGDLQGAVIHKTAGSWGPIATTYQGQYEIPLRTADPNTANIPTGFRWRIVNNGIWEWDGFNVFQVELP